MIDRRMEASAPRGVAARPEGYRSVAPKDSRVSSQTPKNGLTAKVARALLSLAVVLVASILTLLVGEVFVRIFVPTERLVPLNEVILGITAQRPNVSGIHVVPHTFDVSYKTNAQRFRSEKDTTSLPDPHVLRVAVVGDSFTFGWGANDDQSYPSRLDHLLNDKVGPTEVLNAGVCGTGTGNEALWYDLWVRRFHPNLVILTVVPNDVDDDLARPLFSIDASGQVSPKTAVQVEQFQSQTLAARQLITRLPLYDYLTEHSELLNLFRRTISVLIRRRHIKATSAKAGSSAFETVGLRLLAGEVKWLDQQVRSSGAQLIVVFVPFRESVYGQVPKTNRVVSDSLAMVDTLTRECAKDNIPFHDLTSEMKTAAADRQDPLFYTVYDAHPTPAGYQLIAYLVSPLAVDEVQSSAKNSATLTGAK
jgi:lysophospholipase L1-like esterase